MRPPSGRTAAAALWSPPVVISELLKSCTETRSGTFPEHSDSQVALFSFAPCQKGHRALFCGLYYYCYLFILWGLKSEYRRRVWDEDAPNEVAHWGWKASPSFGTFKDGRLCFMSAGLYLPNPFWIIIFIYYYFLSFILLLLFFIKFFFFLNKVTHVHGHPLRPLSNEISPFRISCWSS